MPKGLCFILPSLSVANTLNPFLEELSSLGNEIICYNTDTFRPKGISNFKFKAYPAYERGYKAENLNESQSYFEFGEILIDTAIELFDFLSQEIKREKPDFILHSHLAVWGKLFARYYDLPAICLSSTFILDARIMIPFIQKDNSESRVNLNNIVYGKRLHQKLQSLNSKFGFLEEPNIWDVYVNKQKLTLSFILKEFQPYVEILESEYNFVGPPLQLERSLLNREILYISLGTIFNDDIDFYKLCIKVIKSLRLKSILCIGKKVKAEELGDLPEYIKLEHFTNQAEVLKKTVIFVTHGGMASVMEAVYNLTPMLVIPKIAEQIITAGSVESLGIGIALRHEKITEDVLKSSIINILQNREEFVNNLEKLAKNTPDFSHPTFGCLLTEKYLTSEIQRSRR